MDKGWPRLLDQRARERRNAHRIRSQGTTSRRLAKRRSSKPERLSKNSEHGFQQLPGNAAQRQRKWQTLGVGNQAGADRIPGHSL